MLSKLKRGKPGFTIIELLIAIAIIGILLAVLVPAYASYKDKANGTAAADAMESIIKAATGASASDGNYKRATIIGLAYSDLIKVKDIYDNTGQPANISTVQPANPLPAALGVAKGDIGLFIAPTQTLRHMGIAITNIGGKEACLAVGKYMLSKADRAVKGQIAIGAAKPNSVIANGITAMAAAVSFSPAINLQNTKITQVNALKGTTNLATAGAVTTFGGNFITTPVAIADESALESQCTNLSDQGVNISIATFTR